MQSWDAQTILVNRAESPVRHSYCNARILFELG
jgi:hypothetical protein